MNIALILTAYNGSYVAVANDDSSFIGLDYEFPSSKSNCTILNKFHVVSVTWSNGKNLSNGWSNGKKLMTFNTGNTKGTDHCFIGNLGTPSGNSHLIGCNGEIIGFYRSLTDEETSHIHNYLMKKMGNHRLNCFPTDAYKDTYTYVRKGNPWYQ